MGLTVCVPRYNSVENASSVVHGIQVVAAMAAMGSHSQQHDQQATIMVSTHHAEQGPCRSGWPRMLPPPGYLVWPLTHCVTLGPLCLCRG